MQAKKAILSFKVRNTIIKILLCAGIMLILSQDQLFAQIRIDSTTVIDTVRRTSSDSLFTHSPRKAVIYSLILPGLGQVYNKKYWKIPFIYGAGGTFLYYINYNQDKYKKFRTALFNNQAGTPATIDGYTYEYEQLANGRDYYRRNRDLSVAGFAAIYLLNVIDAMVDATFFRYDISDDLSMKLEPAVIQNIDNIGTTASLGFRINIGF